MRNWLRKAGGRNRWDCRSRILQRLPRANVPDAVPCAKKDVTRELRWKHLSPEKKEDVADATIKQLDKHLAHDAVKRLRVEQATDTDVTIASRMLLTHKFEPERGWKAKASCHSGSHLDPMGDVKTDSNAHGACGPAGNCRCPELGYLDGGRVRGAP